MVLPFWVAASFCPLAATAQQGAALPIGGELKLWHKLTFDFNGPQTSEAATPNPFTDYRLDVTFTHPASGKTLIVPGYYAADGNAAQTSASSGNKWRAHFAPEEVGHWTYTASFRTGPLVAANANPAAGTSAGFFDGQAGTFEIGPTDKSGRDFRAKGRLEYVGKHHLRFAGNGRYFMKAGVDSPENLLAYADFDGDFKTDGNKDNLIKTWTPHIADWREGDPVWQGDKGKGLIGALNYLADEGLNAVSFLTMNINGDDRNVFPYTTYGERLRLDVSRLDQWEIIFEHGTRKGLYLHFKTQETENEGLLDGGDLGAQRKLYYRELIARFSHHLALNWNLGEESRATLARKVAWAQFFRDNDPYHHHIVVHNGSSHFDLMGSVSKVTGMSKQMNEADFGDTFFDVKRWLKKSREEGKPWVVACDEPGNSRDSLRPDSDPGTSHRDARRDALWATIMAGGAGIEFYFGYDYPDSDTTCQDFRSRNSFWPYCGHAVWLFENYPFPFELLSNHHELISGTGSEQTANTGEGGNRCLAKIGDTYLVHLRSGGDGTTLDLSGGTGPFTVKWFDPRNGGPLIPAADVAAGGVVALGNPPSAPTEDWIVLVESLNGGTGTNSPPVTDAGPDQTAFLTDPSVEVLLSGNVTDDGLPDELSLVRAWTKVSGPGEVTFANPAATVTRAGFSEVGTYLLRLSADDSDLGSSDEVLIQIIPPGTTGRRVFSPDQDASTVGGLNENGDLLLVGSTDRLSYLKFDLSGLDAVPQEAVLRISEGGGQASGPMNLSLYAAASNEWTEAGINGANAPAKGALLGSISGVVEAGQEISFALSEHITGPGIYSFVLENEPLDGNLGLASREHPSPLSRPFLEITTVGNSPPVFTAPPVTTQVNVPLTVLFSELLAGAYDPDGDPVSFVPYQGGTTAGGYVTMGPDRLVYTPSIDYSGPDSVLLTVQDGRGTFTSSVLAIQVISPVDLALARTPVISREGGNAVRIRFDGVPDFDHLIQRSVDLQAWTTLATINGGTSGEVDYLDPEPPAGAAFYRIATP